MKIDLGENFIFELNKDERNISLADRVLEAAFSDLVMQLESAKREITHLHISQAIAENVNETTQDLQPRMN